MKQIILVLLPHCVSLKFSEIEHQILNLVLSENEIAAAISFLPTNSLKLIQNYHSVDLEQRWHLENKEKVAQYRHESIVDDLMNMLLDQGGPLKKAQEEVWPVIISTPRDTSNMQRSKTTF